MKETMFKRIEAPVLMVVFGASGDLTKRKLLPALYNLYHQGFLGEQFCFLGYARTENDDDGFRQQAEESVREFANEEFDKLVNDAAGAPTWDDRMKLYAEAEKLMLEDGAAVYIYYPFNIRLYKPWIGGLPKNSAGLSVQDWNIYFGLLNEVYVVEHPDRPKLS